MYRSCRSTKTSFTGPDKAQRLLERGKEARHSMTPPSWLGVSCLRLLLAARQPGDLRSGVRAYANRERGIHPPRIANDRNVELVSAVLGVNRFEVTAPVL